MNVEMTTPRRHRSSRGAHAESRGARAEARVRTGPERTCVGCGQRDDAKALVRLVVVPAELSEAGEAGGGVADVAFDLAGGAFGRGAHLHPVAACVAKAPRGLGRAFKGAVKVDAAVIGRRLVEACDRRMAGLVLAAHRLRAVVAGADAALAALSGGDALGIVAADAGSVAGTVEVQRAAAEGRVIAWGSKNALGGLLGESSVAICAVRHAGIAAELKSVRAAADAGTAATREGAECSRFPEAR
jgi:predicted RNA-binding protein YlxR (DUF448 family)